MKPSKLDLCSAAYYASSISQNANAAYWLECSGVSAEHLRKDLRQHLERMADLFGLKVVEIEGVETVSAKIESEAV